MSLTYNPHTRDNYYKALTGLSLKQLGDAIILLSTRDEYITIINHPDTNPETKIAYENAINHVNKKLCILLQLQVF